MKELGIKIKTTDDNLKDKLVNSAKNSLHSL